MLHLHTSDSSQWVSKSPVLLGTELHSSLWLHAPAWNDVPRKTRIIFQSMCEKRDSSHTAAPGFELCNSRFDRRLHIFNERMPSFHAVMHPVRLQQFLISRTLRRRSICFKLEPVIQWELDHLIMSLSLALLLCTSLHVADRSVRHLWVHHFLCSSNIITYYILLNTITLLIPYEGKAP
jgi:hypothetical protein